MATITFKTYGCSNNVAETEMMIGLLEKEGHIVTQEELDLSAEVIVFNLCSVKGPSVSSCFNEIRKIKKEHKNKKIIIAGCVPRNMLPDIKKLGEDISVISTHHIDEITAVVGSALENRPKEIALFDRKVKLNFPKRRRNPVISIVPILQGCNDFCTYCSTKLVKGNTFSYPEAMILKEVARDVKDGCKEIWLTSQDNGAYNTEKDIEHEGKESNGKDKSKEKSNLPKLIKHIAALPGDFYIRIGMTNPTYTLEHIDGLIEALQHPKVFKFLHIPLQSGNNRVLKEMKRRYTVEDYKQIIGKLKENIPDINIATDIICGFPGETEEEFEDTLKLVQETQPDIINISRFQARPGTRAALMEQIPRKTVRERSKKITVLYRKLSKENKKRYVGKTYRIIIDEKGKKGDDMLGRNAAYRQVVVKKALPLGSVVNVKITQTDTFHLLGEIIPASARLSLLCAV